MGSVYLGEPGSLKLLLLGADARSTEGLELYILACWLQRRTKTRCHHPGQKKPLKPGIEEAWTMLHIPTKFLDTWLAAPQRPGSPNYRDFGTCSHCQTTTKQQQKPGAFQELRLVANVQDPGKLRQHGGVGGTCDLLTSRYGRRPSQPSSYCHDPVRRQAPLNQGEALHPSLRRIDPTAAAKAIRSASVAANWIETTSQRSKIWTW